MNESLNHLLNRLEQNSDSFRNKPSYCLWMSHWIIHWTNYKTDSFRNKVTVYEWPCLVVKAIKKKLLSMNESLNHSLNRLEQNSDSFRSKPSYCLYVWVIESFMKCIVSAPFQSTNNYYFQTSFPNTPTDPSIPNMHVK